MRHSFSSEEHGQMLIWLAVVVPLLILFTAMAVDMGLIYTTKAQLSNSVDAAVLTGAKNYSRGIPTAQALATDMFNANFNSKPATLVYTWCPVSPGCVGATVSLTLKATTIVNTTFMAYLPQWAQWSLSDTGAATRSTLVMSLVLDRSGSMSSNGGGTALVNAVPNFVAYFQTGVDYLGMISFASHARVDVPVTVNFSPAIPNAVAALTGHFSGGTFGTGAGTNPYSTTNGPPLSMADNQQNSVTLPPTEPETKVTVYFTDGLMNTIQDTFNCTNTPPGHTLYNYGGYDSPATNVAALVPTDGTQWADIPTNGPPPYGTSGGTCNGVSSFYSQQYGTTKTFTRANVTPESQWRALYTANVMRNESPIPTYIYVIGLGHNVSTDECTEAFLATLSNDPDGPANYSSPCLAVYNSSLPQGLFVVVPDCPSSACTSELNTAFQIIAAKIQLRLSR